MTNIRLHIGNCLDVLKGYPDNSFDSVVTDPPYGLAFMGKEWDSFGWKQTHLSNTGIGERNTQWVSHGDSLGGSNPTCDTCGGRKRGSRKCVCKKPDWKVKGKAVASNLANERFYDAMQLFFSEVFRVLKPGGHLAAFGGTRTYHRLACAVEDAGFEIRDSINWIYGSGFPKSKQVSVAIDQHLGVERE